ncbi:MAG: sulfatase [Akkermansiaceae bacterium]
MVVPFRLSHCAYFFFVSLCVLGAKEKNVLIFFIDDLRSELGCYGEAGIQSPHIDALASEGMLFERAYCQQAICGPSRISMLSGLYPDSSGIDDLWTPFRKVHPKAVTMPRYFKERGFVTASFGKVYHHRRDDKESWVEHLDRPGALYASKEVMASMDERKKAAQKKGLSPLEVSAASKGPAVESAEVTDEIYQDGAVAVQAIESLRRNKEKPFFMCVGFAKPHLPFAAPKRYWDLYQREKFEVPDRALPEGSPEIAFTKWNELRSYQGVPKEGDLSDELTRELKHGYAACVSFADAQVGKVMAELERLGLREDTIVVLWGDHGYKLGDHGLWCKHTNLELDTRVPFVVSAPGFEKGKRSKALVEMVDVFPTLAKLTGGEVPESCDGMSLEPVLKDAEKSLRPFALSRYPRGSTVGYSMRTDRWRYTEWIKTDSKKIVYRELFDHAETQMAPRNVADQVEYRELVSELSKQLDSAQRVSSSKVKLKK